MNGRDRDRLLRALEEFVSEVERLRPGDGALLRARIDRGGHVRVSMKSLKTLTLRGERAQDVAS